MCDPLSIQDQSVIGSNYCKFLCVLSAERGGKEGGGGERERETERVTEREKPSFQLKSYLLQLEFGGVL